VVNLAFIITGAMSLIAAVFAGSNLSAWDHAGLHCRTTNTSSRCSAARFDWRLLFSPSAVWSSVDCKRTSISYWPRAGLPSFITSDKFSARAILAPAAPLHLGPNHITSVSILGVYGLGIRKLFLGRGFASFDSNPGPSFVLGFRWTRPSNMSSP